MPSLRDILRRKASVISTAKITKAMKMVSAAQLKRAQRAIESARPYVFKLEEMLSNLVGSVGSDYTHELTRIPKDINNIAVIIVSSDRGLCGGFNTALFRSVNDVINNRLAVQYPGAKIHLVCVGKKASSAYQRSKFNVIGSFPGIFSKLQFLSAKQVVDSFKSEFINGNIDKVFVYYNEFVNVIKQTPVMKQVLPIEPKEKVAVIKESTTDYIFEPDRKSILDDLLPKALDIQIYRVLLESNAAEQAARMLAMENATTNANELIKYLELQFNKARQAIITKEMLEIVGGAEALKK
jgi:F-type H+-transporting ATPase subunit gamma